MRHRYFNSHFAGELKFQNHRGYQNHSWQERAGVQATVPGSCSTNELQKYSIFYRYISYSSSKKKNHCGVKILCSTGRSDILCQACILRCYPRFAKVIIYSGCKQIMLFILSLFLSYFIEV